MYLLMLSQAASAFCGYYAGTVDTHVYNSGSQVIVARDGDTTTLTLAQDAITDTSEFALIIPVPAEVGPDDVRELDGQIVNTVDAYSAPRMVQYSCSDLWASAEPDRRFALAPAGAALGCAGGAGADSGGTAQGSGEPTSSVVVQQQFLTGVYEITILSALESSDLLTWLNENGYAVSDEGGDRLQEYIDAGTWFLVARVYTGAGGQETGDTATSDSGDTGGGDTGSGDTGDTGTSDSGDTGETAEETGGADTSADTAVDTGTTDSGSDTAADSGDTAGADTGGDTSTVDTASPTPPPDSSTVWLPPLQIRYPAPNISLPIRLGAASSAGEQDLILYVLSEDGQAGISNYPEVQVEDECLYNGDDLTSFYDVKLSTALHSAAGAGWTTEYVWTGGGCDPCASEPLPDETVIALGAPRPANTTVTRLHMRYRPDEITEDLQIYLSNARTQDQVRYIKYAAFLTRQFPVCDVGWITDATADECNAGYDGGGACAVAGLPIGLFALGALKRRKR